jgi:hypothetical protein
MPRTSQGRYAFFPSPSFRACLPQAGEARNLSGARIVSDRSNREPVIPSEARNLSSSSYFTPARFFRRGTAWVPFGRAGLQPRRKRRPSYVIPSLPAAGRGSEEPALFTKRRGKQIRRPCAGMPDPATTSSSTRHANSKPKPPNSSCSSGFTPLFFSVISALNSAVPSLAARGAESPPTPQSQTDIPRSPDWSALPWKFSPTAAAPRRATSHPD